MAMLMSCFFTSVSWMASSNLFGKSTDLNCKNLIATRGSKGSVGLDENDEIIRCPSYAKDVVDRIGAGDAYLAAASIALESGASLKASMFFASILAGKVIGEMGTGNSLLKEDLWKTIEALTK